MFEAMLLVILLLVFIICFLLYKIYKIKYTETESNSMFIPEIETDEEGSDLKLTSKLNEMDLRISEIEDKLKEQERNVKRLAEALSSG
jgi:flagellar biosynthesis/type III secretory pathway M-ring protein FliF/YscJ